MEVYSEIRSPDGDYIGKRRTSAECWRLIDRYQGRSPHWPASGCYVVKVTRTLVRRRAR